MTKIAEKQTNMKEDYPYIVVPFDTENEVLAREKGMSNTFCKDLITAEEVQRRQNMYSGIKWIVKETENETLNWNLS